MKKYVSILLLLVIISTLFTGCKKKETPFDYIDPNPPYDYLNPNSDHPKNKIAYL